MFVHSLDPVLFSIGPVTIYWYGLVYVLGFVGLYFALRRLTDLSSEEVDSLLVWLVVGLFLGARSFFFAFYRPDILFQAEGFSKITEFFAVWNGGMSFHGALFGLFFAAWLWARRYEHSVWRLLDVGALVAGWFLALGRLANFVNAEILGTPFTGSWCVLFPSEEVCRHPVQLYAALKDIFLGSVLLLVYRSRSFTEGFMFWVFALLYSILRFTVQFWRDEQVVLVGLQVGHLLSAVMFIVAVTVLFRVYAKDCKKLFKAR